MLGRNVEINHGYYICSNVVFQYIPSIHLGVSLFLSHGHQKKGIVGGKNESVFWGIANTNETSSVMTSRSPVLANPHRILYDLSGQENIALKFNKASEKGMVPKGKYSSNHEFLGAMLIFEGVFIKGCEHLQSIPIYTDPLWKGTTKSAHPIALGRHLPKWATTSQVRRSHTTCQSPAGLNYQETLADVCFFFSGANIPRQVTVLQYNLSIPKFWKEFLLSFSLNLITVWIFLLESDSQLSLQHWGRGWKCFLNLLKARVEGFVRK